MVRQSVAITGLGVVLPGCDSRERFWQHLSKGESQLTLQADPSDSTRRVPMGRIDPFVPERYLAEFGEKRFSRYHREQQIYLSSLVLARNDARLDLQTMQSDRLGLFDGTSRGNFAFWYERISQERERDPRELYTPAEVLVGAPGQAANIAAALLHVRGPTYTFNGTCSAGAIAIGHALRELQAGRIDVAFGTGHDTPLIRPIYEMYKQAKLLSYDDGDPRRAVRPFVGHSRNALSEGAITLVLERTEHAKARGAKILALLDGYEYGNTGVHPTDVDDTGLRPAQLIERLLKDAQLTEKDVRFVVGHGNAAPKSDRSELEYMKRVFGERTREVPLVSVKPIYGHAMGASSALSVAAAAMMVHHRFVVPTINVDEKAAAPGFDHQPNVGKDDPCTTGVVVNFGIGGQNTALLLRRPEEGSAA